MRLLLLAVALVALTASVIDCANDFSDGLLEDTRMLEDIQLEETEDETVLDQDNSAEERGVCTLSPKCSRAGGYCVWRGADCNGVKFPMGNRSSKRRCCIPDIRTTTCPPIPACPTIPSPPQPTTCPPPPTCPTPPVATSCDIKNSILEWNFVDEDHFVRFEERMTWDEAECFCTSLGLELYQPKNTTKVSEYLTDNFKISDLSYRYWVGARGNGTHPLWLSGEVVSSDEPFAHDYYGRKEKCLAVTTEPRFTKEGKILWPQWCYGVNELNKFLCGEPHDYALTWHTVGEDTFAWYNRRMNWEDSRALCQKFGLDLYQAKNTTAISLYMNGFSTSDNPMDGASFYWLGAKGNGTHAVWLSGEVIPSSLFQRPESQPYDCVISKYPSSSAYYITKFTCSIRSVYPLCG